VIWGGATYDIIILDTIGLSPGTHDPGIVECNASNDINALALELGQFLDEAGEVLGGATGGEGAGNGEDDDLLVGPLCGEDMLVGVCFVLGLFWGTKSSASRVGDRDRSGKDGRIEAGDLRDEEEVVTSAGIIIDGDTARGDIAGLRGVGDVAEGHAAGQGVSDFQGGRHLG